MIYPLRYSIDGVHIYAGEVSDSPFEGDRGRPYNLPEERLVGSARQPLYGGACGSVLHLRSDGQVIQN